MRTTAELRQSIAVATPKPLNPHAVRDAAIIMTDCPRCHAVAGQECKTPLRRNHTERMCEALRISIECIPAILAEERSRASSEVASWVTRI